MKQPGLAVIMGMSPKDGGEDGYDDGEDGHEMPDHKEAMKDASHECFDALKAHDKDSFHEALTALLDLHKHAPEDDGDSGDEDDDHKSLKLMDGRHSKDEDEDDSGLML